jgi:hypothetical protein
LTAKQKHWPIPLSSRMSPCRAAVASVAANQFQSQANQVEPQELEIQDVRNHHH